MDAQGIKRFLMSLGVSREDIKETDRGWVNTKCPLAPYLHDSGADKRPSFGISESLDGPSVYYCFGCSPRPNRLAHLLWKVWAQSGVFPYDALAVLFGEEGACPEAGGEDQKLRELYTSTGSKGRCRVVQGVPREILLSYPLLMEARDCEVFQVAWTWFKERGVDDPIWVMEEFRLRCNPVRESVVFPMTDRAGNILALHERVPFTKRMWTINNKSIGVPKEDYRFPTSRDVGMWFGFHRVSPTKPIMLVEGEFDTLLVASKGFENVVGSMTSSITKAQVEALVSPVKFLGFDMDHGGEKAVGLFMEYDEGRSVKYRIDWRQAGCEKDPGEFGLTSKALLQSIALAERL